MQEFTVLEKNQVPLTEEELKKIQPVELADSDIGSQVAGIDSEIRQKIENIITTAQDAGHDLDWVERRLLRLLPVSDRDAKWISNYRKELESQGLDSDFIGRRVDEYMLSLRRDRAETVASMEMTRQDNEDERDSYAQAMEEGLIPSTATREWVTMDGCPICVKMDGVKVAADEKFPDGEPGEIHVNCDCFATYSVELPADYHVDRSRDEEVS